MYMAIFTKAISSTYKSKQQRYSNYIIVRELATEIMLFIKFLTPKSRIPGLNKIMSILKTIT